MTVSILPPKWDVPDEIRRRVGSSVGRQRAMFADGHLMLVLHVPPKSSENQRQARLIWRSPAGEWKSTDLGTGVTALKKHVEQYEDAIHRLDRAEESASTADEYFEIIEALMPVTRAAAHLHQVLQQARQFVPVDKDIINVRDQSYETERTGELLEQQLKNRMDYAIALRSEEQTRHNQYMALAAHRLNMLAALFLPLATVAAVFGMELEHGIDLPQKWLFAIVVAGGLTAGVLLTLLIVSGGKPAKTSNRS